MTNTVIPSRLYRVKTFESVANRYPVDGGDKITLITESLEAQIDAWVGASKSMIVATGPVTLLISRSDAGLLGMAATVTETRTLALIYIPAVEQPTHVRIYGEQQFRATETTALAGTAGQDGSIRAPAASAPGGPEQRIRGTLGLPKI